MSTIRSSRHIASDPTSTALLLSGPTALDLWPRLQRVQDAPGQYVALGAVAEGALGPVLVRSDLPRRTATAYVTRFSVEGEQVPQAAGELLVRGSWANDQPGANVEVWLASDGWDSRIQHYVSKAVEAFLDNLANVGSAPARATA